MLFNMKSIIPLFFQYSILSELSFDVSYKKYLFNQSKKMIVGITAGIVKIHNR